MVCRFMWRINDIDDIKSCAAKHNDSCSAIGEPHWCNTVVVLLSCLFQWQAYRLVNQAASSVCVFIHLWLAVGVEMRLVHVLQVPQWLIYLFIKNKMYRHGWRHCVYSFTHRSSQSIIYLTHRKTQGQGLDCDNWKFTLLLTHTGL